MGIARARLRASTLAVAVARSQISSREGAGGILMGFGIVIASHDCLGIIFRRGMDG